MASSDICKHIPYNKAFGPYRGMSSFLKFFAGQAAAERALQVSNSHIPNSKGPLVQFARFVNGQLTLFGAHTTELKYIAISHVWGKIDWLQVSGVTGDVLTSKQKAVFIETRLPALVGKTAFWMDTLTVNQRNKEEVISTVQSIPDIFRDAIRTIVIRECDGLYDCCRDEVIGFDSWGNFLERIAQHGWTHYKDIFVESYLQRLWCLQECLLSHTLEFVLCGDNEPKELVHLTRGLPDIDDGHLKLETITDSLYILACAFAESDSRGIVDFMKAYVFGGTVRRSIILRRNENEDIHTGNFQMLYQASLRMATEPRDYIFATMPQFPWYIYPANAASMSFNDIFIDLHEQGMHKGHPFAARVTTSMTDPVDALSLTEAWLPSHNQPNPSCLGDFLKLLGYRLPADTVEPGNETHLTSEVNVTGLEVNSRQADDVLEIILSAMHFSWRTWQESHKAGELSKYGNFPDDKWVLDENEEEPNDDYIDYSHIPDSWRYIPPPALKKTLVQQSTAILDHMWCGTPGLNAVKNKLQQEDWRVYRASMNDRWTNQLLESMLLLAAMISCHIGLSAFDWARENFVPVLVEYHNINILGLVSKHARRSSGLEPIRLLSVGRHVSKSSVVGSGGHEMLIYRNIPSDSIGKDLLLVDPESKVPVGLLPDFLTNFQTDEEVLNRVISLYGGLVTILGPGVLAVRINKLVEQ